MLRKIAILLTLAATLWPQQLTGEAYAEIWLNAGFPTYFINSLIVSVSTAVLSVVFGALAAYGFSRFRMPGDFARSVQRGLRRAALRDLCKVEHRQRKRTGAVQDR